MEKLSEAQEKFANQVLKVQYDSANESVLTEADLAQNLSEIGVTEYTKLDFNRFVDRMIRDSDKMTNIARYRNGHLFDLYEGVTALEK